MWHELYVANWAWSGSMLGPMNTASPDHFSVKMALRALISSKFSMGNITAGPLLSPDHFYSASAGPALNQHSHIVFSGYTFRQCCFKVGPLHRTLMQQETHMNVMCVCWELSLSISLSFPDPKPLQPHDIQW